MTGPTTHQTDDPPATAARFPTPGPQIVDLRQLSARDLDPLLREEVNEFERELDWDFTRSADLVLRQAEAKGLSGAALLDRGEVAGYGCAVVAGNKGLIWDLYVRSAWRREYVEPVLFRVLLEALIGTSGVHRVESQLMLAGSVSANALPGERSLHRFERFLLKRDTADPLPTAGASVSQRFRVEPWQDHYLDPAATVVSQTYAGHVDSQISDEYRTVAAARSHVFNIVQFPGSATFCPPASYVAFDTASGSAAGISLASFVAGDVGHIAHLCVAPEARGAGLGCELLNRSLTSLRKRGAKRVSLTVTAVNGEAVRLYRRFGFRTVRTFHAYVWETAPQA